MNGEPTTIFIVRTVTKEVEKLAVHEHYDKVEAVICIRNDHKERCLFISDAIKIEFVITDEFAYFLDL